MYDPTAQLDMSYYSFVFLIIIALCSHFLLFCLTLIWNPGSLLAVPVTLNILIIRFIQFISAGVWLMIKFCSISKNLNINQLCKGIYDKIIWTQRRSPSILYILLSIYTFSSNNNNINNGTIEQHLTSYQ